MFDVVQTLKGIVRGTAAMLVGALLTLVLNPLLRLVVSRNVGPTGYGFVALGFSVLTISASFTVLGLDAGLVRFIPFYEARKDPAKIKGIILFSSGVVLCSGVLVGAGLYLGAPSLAAVLSRTRDFVPLMRIFAVSLPFMALTQLFVAGLRGFRQVRMMVIVNSGFGDGLRILLLLLFLARGLSVIAVSIAYLISYIVTSCVSCLLLTRTVHKMCGGLTGPFHHDVRELADFSLPLFFSQGLAQLVRQMDILILGYFVSVHDVGIYAAALLFPRVLAVIAGTLNAVFPPYVASLYSEGKMSQLKDVYQTVIRWAFYGTFPVVIVVSAMPRDLLRLAFGSAYEGGATVLTVVLLGTVLVGVPGSLQDEAVMAVGKTRVNLLASLMALVCGGLCGLLTVPLLGLLGGALANVVASAAFFATEFVLLYGRFHLQPFGKGHLKFMAASCVGGALAFGLSYLPMAVSYKLILAFLLAYGAGFWGLVLLKGVDEIEIGLLQAMGRTLTGAT